MLLLFVMISSTTAWLNTHVLRTKPPIGDIEYRGKKNNPVQYQWLVEKKKKKTANDEEEINLIKLNFYFCRILIFRFLC